MATYVKMTKANVTGMNYALKLWKESLNVKTVLMAEKTRIIFLVI